MKFIKKYFLPVWLMSYVVTIATDLYRVLNFYSADFCLIKN